MYKEIIQKLLETTKTEAAILNNEAVTTQEMLNALRVQNTTMLEILSVFFDVQYDAMTKSEAEAVKVAEAAEAPKKTEKNAKG